MNNHCRHSMIAPGARTDQQADFANRNTVHLLPGNVTSIFAPPERDSEIWIEPPLRSTNFLASGKPIPVPRDFVVKNGSKTFSRLSAGIPSPVSSMDTTTCGATPLPGSALVRIVTVPPLGVASSALVI